MLSLQLFREQPDLVRAGLARRGEDTSVVDRVLALDEERRRLTAEADRLRAVRNEVSRKLGKLAEKPPELIAEMRAVGDRIKELEAQLEKVEAQLNDLLLAIPNLPDPSVPDGQDERDNVVVRTWGEPRLPDFPPRPHWELGELLDIIDFERGAKLSGSRFYVLKGAGARLQRALIAWMLDVHTREHGYSEIYPPYLVRREVMVGSGQLPKFYDNLYHDDEDDLWLIPTAEVPLLNLHRDEILEPGTLPLYYVAYSACFRREKAAAGRDTRGIKRVHQFDKVEMFKFVEPAASDEELEKMVRDAEDILQRLGLPYRVVLRCVGDLGFTAMKGYDLEVWAPGVQEWLEVSSCSNVGDFQCRRANIRYRPQPRARPEYPHALNGSGVALPRTMIAILENYQQPDGSVVIPDVLRPYLHGEEVIRPPR